jgi:hypothetical protein
MYFITTTPQIPDLLFYKLNTRNTAIVDTWQLLAALLSKQLHMKTPTMYA